MKTPAIDVLDSLKIPYKREEFDVNKKNISPFTIAEDLGISVENIYKTLVIDGNHTSYLVAVVPVTTRLKLQKVAAVSGNSNCKLIPLDKLEELTGYVHGGCSPVGMKTDFPTYIQQEVTEEEEIRISGGKRGLFLVVKPADIIRAANAIPADLIA